ncbi:hypothetical protein [Paenibacillus sp. GCM10012306]|uniref:hypothetical protein n=1 Tax=Paenibacillus sp. GCM10012306 TaxID=3317342 RepID=UPI00360CD575
MISQRFSSVMLKSLFFFSLFIFIYGCSFWYGTDFVQSIFVFSSNQTIEFLVYGTMMSSILAFIITMIVHIFCIYFCKSTDFTSWFRAINLLILYLTGLGTAIIAMKNLLIEDGAVTGNETIFSEQYNLLGLIFFIAIFNYNVYNSLFLAKEIPGFTLFLENLKHLVRKIHTKIFIKD